MLVVSYLQGYPQSNQDSLPKYKFKNRFSFYSNFGFSYYSEISTLNKFLNTNGYPKIINVFYDFNFFGFENQWNRLVMKIYASHATNNNKQTSNTNDYKTALTETGISGFLGYEIIDNARWSVYPSIGFEFSGLWLELTKQVSDTSNLNNLILSPNITKINQSNLYLNSEIGIRHNPNDVWTMGIYLGYKYDPVADDWMYESIKLTNNPKIKLSGFYLNFSIQYNLFDYKK